MSRRTLALPLLALLALLAPVASGCGREVGVELEHQPPTVSLQGPSTVELGQSASFSATAEAHGGALRGYTFEVHRDNIDLVRHEEESAPSFSHRFEQLGTYYVSVVVADEKWATARASLPVRVTPAVADDKTPPTVELTVNHGDEVLGPGAGLSYGDQLTILVAAQDGELGVGALELHAWVGAVEVPLGQAAIFETPGRPASAQHSYQLAVPQTAGTLRLEATARDVAQPPNTSQPTQRTFPVSAKDSDGDGLADDDEVGGCADAQTYNGLQLQVWRLAPFPKALCWLVPRPAGETLVGQVTTSTPAYTTRVQSGMLSGSGTGSLETLLPAAPAPVRALTSFALYYTGTLCLPVGAATLELEATGDDVLVITIDGQPQAANDVAVGCTSYFDWPAFAYVKSSASVDVAGLSKVGLGLLVASESGAWSFTAKLGFKDAAGDPLSATLDQKMFQAP